MGGRLQIRRSGKAKKGWLLLRTTGVLRFIQLDVGVVYCALGRLDILHNASRADVYVLLPSRGCGRSLNNNELHLTRICIRSRLRLS